MQPRALAPASDATPRAVADRLARDAFLLANVSDAVVVTDPDGVVSYWNDGAAQLFGWTADELVGRPLTDRFPPAARLDVAAAIQDIVAGKEWDGEFEDYRKDGSRVWIHARVRRLTDAAGTPVAVMGVSRDVSDRKRMEGELRRSADELAVAARRKDEFLATLAHELRNPLAPIANAVEIMRLDDRLSPAAAKARGTIERQLGQLVRLVDDLLDVSRIGQGKVELQRQRVDIRDVTHAAVETCQPLLASCRHELVEDVPAEAVWVAGDPFRLTQVVANLLNNAAKYTPAGGHVRLSVRTNGDAAVVRVSDTGVGIRAGDLPRVFELFAQVGSRQGRLAQSGLGIGLALVKGLVEMHGGTVEARSDGPGTGSEFVVRIPLAGEES